MVIQENIRSAKTISQHLDGDLVIAFGQAYPLNCPLGVPTQVRLQILKFFYIRQFRMGVNSRLEVLPKTLPLTKHAGEDGNLKLRQGNPLSKRAEADVSRGFLVEFAVNASRSAA